MGWKSPRGAEPANTVPLPAARSASPSWSVCPALLGEHLPGRGQEIAVFGTASARSARGAPPAGRGVPRSHPTDGNSKRGKVRFWWIPSQERGRSHERIDEPRKSLPPSKALPRTVSPTRACPCARLPSSNLDLSVPKPGRHRWDSRPRRATPQQPWREAPPSPFGPHVRDTRSDRLTFVGPTVLDERGRPPPAWASTPGGILHVVLFTTGTFAAKTQRRRPSASSGTGRSAT